uniref:UPAR/Ly6 domain-containing protein n=1 Tax=Parascaris univalens TaxID=6257 RepID=A0A915C810_PARUN
MLILRFRSMIRADSLVINESILSVIMSLQYKVFCGVGCGSLCSGINICLLVGSINACSI